MTTNFKKRNPASTVRYSCRPCRSRFHRIHLCKFSTLVTLILLYSEASSAQVYPSQTEFVFTNSVDSLFNESTITCLGYAKLSNDTLGEDHRTGPMCLTPKDLPGSNSTGRCLYKSAVRFSKGSGNGSPSFSTMFSFNSFGYPNFGQGQGFTFFIGPNNTYQGESGLYLGWLDDTTANNASGNNFAVEFDIFRNSQVNDSDNNHVGINVNSLKSTYSVWYSKPLTTYSTSILLYVWADYDGLKEMIDVRVSTTKERPCDSLIYENLTLSSVLSPEEMYVGFSAATGDNSTNTQTTIYDWSFSTLGPYMAKNIYGSYESCWRVTKVPWLWILAGAIGVLTVAMAFAVFSLRRRTRTIIDLERALSEIQNLDCGPHEFTYKELSRATNSFSDKLLIGAGGFAKVYKGTLSKDSSNNLAHDSNEEDSLTTKCSRIVAVKKLKNPSLANAKDYVAEVKVIGRMRHINLVRLLGWCHERNELLLVYDYMPNGNLQELLTKKQDESHGREVLCWEKRKTILRGVAAALLYLHEEFEQRVLHRDVKSSNVMIDKEFHARLGDFGLARSYDRSEDYWKSTKMAGTIGYIAPECVVTGVATSKSDVYSFGAVVLEVATGKNPHYGSEGLAKWVWRLKEDGKVLEAADEQLAGLFSREEMEKILTLGIFCCLPDPDARPTMRQALSVLQERESQISLWSKLPALPRSGLSLKNFDGDNADSITMSSTDWGSHYSSVASDDSFLSRPQDSGKDFIAR